MFGSFMEPDEAVDFATADGLLRSTLLREHHLVVNAAQLA
jgi:hypothetical protein